MNKTLFQPRFYQQLSFQLFFWLVLVALIPLSVLAYLHQSQTNDQLRSKAEAELRHYNRQLGNQINAFYDAIVTNLVFVSENAEVYLNELITSRQQLNMPLDQWLISENYSIITSNYSLPLISYFRYFNYENVIIGDKQGNILFNGKGSEETGLNVYRGWISKTPLASAVHIAMNEQTTVYSGVGQYWPHHSTPESFFVGPLFDTRGRPLGFIAIQLRLDYGIPDILQVLSEENRSIHLYLVDTEGKVEHYFGPNQTPLVQHSGIPYTQWQNGAFTDSLDYDEANTASIKSGQYQNSTEEKIIGAYQPLDIAGSEMLLVAELPESQAITSITQLKQRFLLVLVITIAGIILFAGFISHRLTHPVRSITQWIQKIARNESTDVRVIKGNRDVEALSECVVTLNTMLTEQRKSTEKRLWLEEGMSGLYEVMNGVLVLDELCQSVTSYLARSTGSPAAALYIKEASGGLKLMGRFGHHTDNCLNETEQGNGGLIEEAAQGMKTIEINQLPESFFRIRSAHLNTHPNGALITPFLFNNQVKGVLVMAYFNQTSEIHRELIEKSKAPISGAIHALN